MFVIPMIRQRIILLYLVIFFLASAILGCAKKDNKVVTFAIGGTPNEIEFLEVITKEFEKQSGIKVNILRRPTDTDQRRQGLVVPLRSRKSNPDIFLMDVAWISQFVESGWLEPLENYIKKHKLDINVYFKRILKLADTYNNVLMALPVYVDGGMLYYRKDLLQKYGYEDPPKTWKELISYSIAIQSKERKANKTFYGFVWQGAQYEGLICNFLEVAGSGGGGILIKDKKISLNTPENKKAVQYMYDLIYKYKISPPNTFTEMKEEEVRMFFQNGNSLFERNWPYAWALHSNEDSQVKNKVAITSLPHFPSGESISTLGGWHIGISKYSDVKNESFQFLKFITSYNTQKRLAMKLGWNPGRKDVYNDKEIIQKMPHFVVLKKIFERAYPRPKLPFYTLISEVLQRNINSVLCGRVDVDTALLAAEKEAQIIIDRYAKK